MSMSWLEHRYGPNVHILANPLLQTWLTELCQNHTKQPRLNQLVEYLYKNLLSQVMSEGFDRKQIEVPTRMTEAHPDSRLTAEVINRDLRAITVNLARAGTWPSHLCYELLNDVLNPDLVRQDHVFAARIANNAHQVTGTQLGSHKIGGDQQDAYVLFPDPMGATGHTLIAAVDYYKKQIEGKAKKYMALHLIVTPEYLKNVLAIHPDLEIYTLRVDRGLSPADVLQSPLGEHWDKEKGLNQKDYIVPGAGGLGELLNNSFV